MNLIETIAEVHSTGGGDRDLWPAEVLFESRLRSLEKDVSVGAMRDGRYGWLSAPLDYVARDLNIGTPTAGGNLIGSPRKLVGASLRGFSAVADAGATVLSFGASTNAPSYPSTTAPPVAGWVASEGGDVPQDSNFTVGLATVSPRTLGLWFRISRRLLLLGGDAADELIRQEIMQAIGRGIDKGVLQGTGSSGEPLGLNGVSGVHAQSGTSLAWAGIQNMLEAVGNGGARDADIRFIGTPAVRKLLAQRERAAGSGLVWDAASISGRPADVSLQCPAGTLFAGDFSQLVVSVHGGINLVVDRMRATDGSARVCAMVDMDVQAPYPAAFSRATSIT